MRKNWYKPKKKKEFTNFFHDFACSKSDIILLKALVAIKALLLMRINLLAQPENRRIYIDTKYLKLHI